MLGVLFIFLASLSWALDTLIRYPLLFSGTSALVIVFYEHLILTLVFLPLILKNFKMVLDLKVSSIIYFLMIGVGGSALGTLFFTEAFSLINPSLVILLQKLQPIVAIIFARFFLKEEIKKEFIFFGVICLIGAILLSWSDLTGITSVQSFFNEQAFKGYLLTLGAVFFWGMSTVFGKKLSLEGKSEYEIMAGRFVFGFSFLIYYVFFRHSQTINLQISFESSYKILGMVLLSGLLGMYFYYNGLKRVSAKVCALSEMFFPLCAVLINYLFLNKALSLMQMIGGALLILGATVIQIKRY